MNADLLADYRRRGWALVPIPVGQKRPVAADWQNRDWPEAHFCTGGNVGVIFGSRSGEVVDVDLDCGEALELADLFLPAIGVVFGRPSKPHSHRMSPVVRYSRPSAIQLLATRSSKYALTAPPAADT